MGAPRIALIHALEASVLPARLAFAETWPEAQVFDLLDTSLASDLAGAGELTAAMMSRFQSLASYASCTPSGCGGTRAILFTCSAFGPAIDAVKSKLPIPVLRPNEAAFAAALDDGSRIGLLVTFEPSRPALESELHTMAVARGRRITMKTICADGALRALQRGDGRGHDEALAKAAERLGAVDTVILGQFSSARARDHVARATGLPVITTPTSAVMELRRLLSD